MTLAASPGTVLGITVACGVATYLMRVLPLWRAGRRRGNIADPAALAPRNGLMGALSRFVQGVGPAAIAALLAASLLPPPAPLGVGLFGRWLPTVGGLAAVALIRWRLRGLAWPTLGGAVVYGLLRMLVA